MQVDWTWLVFASYHTRIWHLLCWYSLRDQHPQRLWCAIRFGCIRGRIITWYRLLP